MPKYQRTTNRSRKYPIEREELQPDGTVKVNRYQEPNVLVGFGSHDLVDFVGCVDLVNEAFVKRWPPRYRRQSICTPEEVELFREFTTWLAEIATKR